MRDYKELLRTCGCCEVPKGPSSDAIANRPGLSALAYRVGTHGLFKAAMLQDLSRHKALERLTTREDEDFSVSLLDAWAVVADVLAFYQERIANEGFLRTATERLSVLELARLIGYELNPGVAAAVLLAFTIEDTPDVSVSSASAAAVPAAPGAAVQAVPAMEDRIIIDIGTEVQSIPAQDELPQTFETIEKIEARKEWNSIRALLTKRHTLKKKTRLLYLNGLTSELKKGDRLFFSPEGHNALLFCQVTGVTGVPDLDHTEVKLRVLSEITNKTPKDISDQQVSSKPVAGLYMKDYIGKKFNSDQLYAAAKTKNFNVHSLFTYLRAVRPSSPSVITFRLKAAIFGHNAPNWDSLPVNQRYGEMGYTDETTWEFIEGAYFKDKDSWVDSANTRIYEKGAGDQVLIYLDNTYPGIVKGSWVLLADDTHTQVYQVVETGELTHARFTLSVKVTCLTLKVTAAEKAGLNSFSIRRTSVFGQSEALELARTPVTKPVKGKDIVFNDWVGGLARGQTVIVCGESRQARGTKVCEPAVIATVVQDLSFEGNTSIQLKEGLKNEYVRDTVTINANVAAATHGESVSEVLGSGDSSRLFQEFFLRQPPLTYVSASTASGVATTLKVRVNDLLWKEVLSFYGRGPDEHIYITRQDNKGNTLVRFGDGITGSRLPTGRENVTASYRKGIGLDGLVKPGQLSLLMNRPFGVKGVDNALPSSGAAAAENLEKARQNSPLTVLTLDRVVSLRDFEDFAHAFAGIEKARADWVWDGETRLVYLTVAGAKGKPVGKKSDLYKNLREAVKSSGTGRQAFRIESYASRSFFIKAKIMIDPQFVKDKVKKKVKTTLDLMFSFERRRFGQPVTQSEVMAVIQGISGVTAVDLEELYLAGENMILNAYLPARIGRWDRQLKQPAPAELLTLSPEGTTLLEMEK